MHSQRLVIIGGGIAGLAAAWEASAHSAVQVTVVDDHLAGPGGKLRTSPVAGVATDEGADVFLTRVPEGLALADELGLGDRLRAPSAGGAAIWMDGAAHPMPTGLVLGVPVDPSSLEGSSLVDPSDVEARCGPSSTARGHRLSRTVRSGRWSASASAIASPNGSCSPCWAGSMRG
ncbi:MAG: FAD-dependent oxidoreductase [Acidimicrobiales bacterium]